MAKDITIEVFDAKYDVTTVGSQTLKDLNNTPDPNFANSLYGLNIAQTGCAMSTNVMDENYLAASGAPSSSVWKPYAYLSTAPPGPGFCSIIYRDTPVPAVIGTELHLGGTTVNTTEYVTNPSFALGGVIGGMAIYYPFGAYYSIVYGLIGPPVNSTQAWYVTNTVCYNAGYGVYNPTSSASPGIYGGGGQMTMYAGIPDTCGAGGVMSISSCYQLITGLTIGKQYTLTVNKTADVNEMCYLGMGFAGTLTDFTTGNTYTTLGGANAPIYGSGGAGSLWGGMQTASPQSSGYFTTQGTQQSNTFYAQATEEVLLFEYLTDTSSPGTQFGMQNVSIVETQQQPLNLSGVYGIADCYDINTGTVPGIGKLRLNLQTIDDSVTGDVISVSFNQAPLQGNALGLEPMSTTEMRISNNPLYSPTHNMVLGSNTYSFFINPTSSVAPFSPNDRLVEMSFANSSGNTIEVAEIDIELWSYTVPTTYQTIDYERSMVGILEVSNSEDFPLELSYNISDGKDLDARFGDYSQTFDLPATARNNKTLNYIWDAKVAQEERKTWGIKDCVVNVDGVPFFNGSMQIKKSSHDSSPKSYSCTLYGGNFSWMTLLKDKELCTVYDPSEVFTYDYFAIESAWLQFPNGSYDIQYPIVSYRDFNPNGLPNYINTNNLNTPPDIIPHFYVYSIFKKIFKNIGYTVSSTFLETTHIKRLLTNFPFLSNSAKDDAVYFSSEQRRNSNSFQTVQANQGLGSLTTNWTTCKLNHNVTDPSQSYNNATGIWKCQKAGTYDVYANMGFVIQLTSDYGSSCGSYVGGSCDWGYTSSAPFDSWTWMSRVKVTTSSGVSYGNTTSAGWGQTTGSPLDWWLVYCWDTSTQLLTIPSFSVNLDVGDTIELQGKHIGQNLGGCEPKVNTLFGYDVSSSSLGNQQPWMSITYTNAVPSIGSDVQLNDVIPCDISQVDFVKGLAHLYNLYFTTDVQNKVIHIEPFNDFFKGTSEAVDWSTKVDYSQDIEDDYNVGLKSELQIGYKVDNADKFAKILNDNTNEYGEQTRLYDYNENLGDDFESGRVEILNPVWASTTQVWDNDAFDDVAGNQAPILIPNLWTEDCYSGLSLGNNQYRPPNLIENFVPRIFYFGYEATTGFTSLFPPFTVPNPSGTPTHWSRITAGGNTNFSQNQYPRATFVDWEEFNHASTMRPSLSFEDEVFTAPGQTATNTVPGLFTMYYKNMIDQLKQSPRIRVVYINLKLSDILNLDMRRLIQLDETVWRINRIVGFSPANNQSTKVELIQWLEVGSWPIYTNDSSGNPVRVVYQ